MIELTICIVGAGPGGVTAALHLANRGIPSVVIDKAVFPRDKICGDALSGKVVGELNRIDPQLLQRLDNQAIGLPSWGIHFVAPNGRKLSVPFKQNFNPASDKKPGYIVRRMEFDNFLIEEARRRPEITLVEGVEIDSYQREGEYWLLADKKGTVAYKARLLLVANGAQSGFSRTIAGLPLEPAHYCAGLRAYYQNVSGLDTHNFIELHFLKEFLPGYLWVFPLPGGFANVGVGMLKERISAKKINLKEQMLAMIQSHPELSQRFAQAELVGEIKGYGLPLGSKKRPVSGDGYLLIGDAAHLIDPFTGEGISNAMISGRWAAEYAAEASQTGNFSASFLKQYDQAVYHRLGKELQLSHRMQRLLDYPWLFNVLANKATQSQALAQTLSCMFTDLDIRQQLKSPLFYLKLLLNR